MMREEAAANYGAKYLARRSYLDRIASANANALVRAWNKMKRWIADVKAKDLATARLMERYTQSIAKYIGTTYAVESTMASVVREGDGSARYSFSSMANTFFGDEKMTASDFESKDYKQTDGYTNENKSRVNDWLKVNRLQLPLPNSQSPAFNNSIHQSSENVKGISEKTRFELSEDRGYSKGQAAKIVANARKSKVYSKAEAEKAIDNVTALVSDLTSETNILRKADIRGKSRAEVIDYLWERMNAAQEKDRLNVATRSVQKCRSGNGSTSGCSPFRLCGCGLPCGTI